MNHFASPLRCLSLVALAALAGGCTSTVDLFGVRDAGADAHAMDVPSTPGTDVVNTADVAITSDTPATDAPTTTCSYPAAGAIVPSGGYTIGFAASHRETPPTDRPPRIVADSSITADRSPSWSVSVLNRTDGLDIYRFETADTSEVQVVRRLSNHDVGLDTGLGVALGIDSAEVVGNDARILMRVLPSETPSPDHHQLWSVIVNTGVTTGGVAVHHLDSVGSQYVGEGAVSGARVYIPVGESGVAPSRDLSGLRVFVTDAYGAMVGSFQVPTFGSFGLPGVSLGPGFAFVTYTENWDFPDSVALAGFNAATLAPNGINHMASPGGSCFAESYSAAVSSDGIAFVEDCRGAGVRMTTLYRGAPLQRAFVTTERGAGVRSRIAWNGESFAVAYQRSGQRGPTVAFFGPDGAARGGSVQLSPPPAGNTLSPVTLDIAGLPGANGSWGVVWVSASDVALPLPPTDTFITRMGRCGTNAAGSR